SEGATRLFDGEPARLCRPCRIARDLDGGDRRRAADRHARLWQDHPLLLRGRDLYGDPQDGNQRYAGAGAQDADHLHRLPDRLPQHHRPAAARRQLEQILPDDRCSRYGPADRPYCAADKLASQYRLSDASRDPRFLPAPAGGYCCRAAAAGTGEVRLLLGGYPRSPAFLRAAARTDGGGLYRTLLSRRSADPAA